MAGMILCVPCGSLRLNPNYFNRKDAENCKVRKVQQCQCSTVLIRTPRSEHVACSAAAGRGRRGVAVEKWSYGAG